MLQPVAGTCDSPLRAELSLRGSSVLFTPSSGTVILRGHSNGSEVMAQLTLVTPEHKPYTNTFNGRIGAGDVDGTYATPRCRYRVHLAQTQD